MSKLKIHCILPSSPWLADSKTNIPLGVLYIGAVLREKGHDVFVTSRLGCRANDPFVWSKKALEADIHMVGFCTPQFNECIDMAADLREKCPGSLIVAGGPHPSYEPEETITAVDQGQNHPNVVLKKRRDYTKGVSDKPVFDSAIVMEGEVAILRLIEDWENGRLQKTYYGDKSEIPNLDVIPFPAWDLLPEDHIYNDGVAVMKKNYFPAPDGGHGPCLSLIGTRGCPYKCTYCFVDGTLVDMADGSRLEIEAIKVGDILLSFNRETGDLESKEVTFAGTRWASDVYRLEVEDGRKFEVTGDHPFVTDEGWKQAKDCKGAYVRSHLYGMQDKIHNGQRQASKNVFEKVFGDIATWGKVEKGSYGENGSIQSIRRSGGQRKNEAKSYSEVQRGSRSFEAEEGFKTVHIGTEDFTDNNYRQEKEESQALGRAVSTNEGQQPYETSRRSEEDGQDLTKTLQGRKIKASGKSSLFERGKNTLRLFYRKWLAGSTLWEQGILDWSMQVGYATEPGYASCQGKDQKSNSLFQSALEDTRESRYRTPGLFGSGLERSPFVERSEQQQAYGGCPGQRIPGKWVRVKSVTFVGERQVRTISVKDNETFFAEGIATHNCSTPWISQPPRYRSSHNIITEMAKAMDLGIRMFKFQDDTYTLHRTKLRELSKDIQSAFGPNSFAARIHTRVNTMDDDIAESLKRMNCRITCFGIESGSQKVLDQNCKGTKVAQNTQALKTAKEHGFYTIAFLVAGLAGETRETMRETQEWLMSVKPYLDSCNLAVGIPYPGSRFWSHPDESRIEILDFNYDHTWIVGFSARNEILVRPYETTYDEMMEVKSEMFDFLKAEGWSKAEWDEDVRIKKNKFGNVDPLLLPSQDMAPAM